MSSFSRKEFLKQTALASLAFAPSIGRDRSKALRKFSNTKGEAKNIIFMVSDGMSSGTLALADLMSRRQYGRETNWIKLYNSTDQKYHRGLMDMASRNSPVTDSAAAASSWGAGHRINNGAINVSPDGSRHKPIAKIFRDAGKKTGLVTTTRMTHATPAGFSANVPDRNMEDEIALQYLEREYDLLMGGGARHFDKDRRDDGNDLFAGFKAKNYHVAQHKNELPSATASGKLLGIFADSHLPYTIDRKNDPQLDVSVPTIAEMTEFALNRLDKSGDGFLLQVEGGRVDHGAHGNDAAALIYDQIEFDEAIGVVFDFIAQRDDTLLVITTDHGNANPGLNGAGDHYAAAGDMLDRIQGFSHTNDWILSELDARSTTSQIQDRVETATSLGISSDQARMIRQSLNDNLQTVYAGKSSPKAVLGSVLANYISINWLGTVHTSDYVELAAIGPGIEQMDSHIRNTEMFDMMVSLSGVSSSANRG